MASPFAYAAAGLVGGIGEGMASSARARREEAMREMAADRQDARAEARDNRTYDRTLAIEGVRSERAASAEDARERRFLAQQENLDRRAEARAGRGGGGGGDDEPMNPQTAMKVVGSRFADDPAGAAAYLRKAGHPEIAATFEKEAADASRPAAPKQTWGEWWRGEPAGSSAAAKPEPPVAAPNQTPAVSQSAAPPTERDRRLAEQNRLDDEALARPTGNPPAPRVRAQEAQVRVAPAAAKDREIGEIYRSPGTGKLGRWNGQGWELID